MKARKNTRLFILSALFLTCCGWAGAQTAKGKIMVGELTHLTLFGQGSSPVNLGYSTLTHKSDDEGTTADTYKVLALNLIPKAGYFVIDNLLIGLDMTLAYTQIKAISADNLSSETIFTAGPFVRYYLPLSKIYPFAEVFGSLGHELSKYEPAGSEVRSYKSGLRLLGGGLGIAVPVGEKVMFDVIAGYSSMVNKDRENNEDNRKEVTNSLGLKLGFSFFL